MAADAERGGQVQRRKTPCNLQDIQRNFRRRLNKLFFARIHEHAYRQNARRNRLRDLTRRELSRYSADSWDRIKTQRIRSGMRRRAASSSFREFCRKS